MSIKLVIMEAIRHDNGFSTASIHILENNRPIRVIVKTYNEENVMKNMAQVQAWDGTRWQGLYKVNPQSVRSKYFEQTQEYNDDLALIVSAHDEDRKAMIGTAEAVLIG